MTLKVHNTLTRKKEEFVPITKGKVGIYACGITAYDSCHLGHARAAITFDVIVRYLRHVGYDVTYVRNFTDVDDKIINRANKDGVASDIIAKRYIKEYDEDMAALGLIKPDLQPKATEHIPHMIAAIEKLVVKGVAYVVEGNVFYSVRAFKGYGKLSGKNIEELESGARVEVDERKKDPLDFALWKASKPGEPSWPSPWGSGRPGWHIECSAMSTHYLGQPFDIHGGGRDLIFPHHENEIAQAEGATGKQFARYWIHNGFVNINAEKMSKSLGNITTIRELLKHHDAEVLRLFLLSSHYRYPIDYTEQAITDAKAMLDRFYETAGRIQEAALSARNSSRVTRELVTRSESAHSGPLPSFQTAMNDDFNTPQVIGSVFELVRAVNRALDTGDKKSAKLCQEFMEIQKVVWSVLGVFGSDPVDYQARMTAFATRSRGVDTGAIEKLIAERNAARKAKNFKRADEIRHELLAEGVDIKDRPGGTTEWKIR